MQRMRGGFLRPVLVLLAGFLAGTCLSARGDLIRPRTARTYPDVAGDFVGSQTYTYDPASKTGTFQVVNAPQLITLGPKSENTVTVTPSQDGTLSQRLRLTLDQHGKLVETPDNRFELIGTVVIDNREYRGVLLEGKPTAFGARPQHGALVSSADVFDLNMKITGGKLAHTFGDEAYFRIMPQSGSTFQGSFAASFSGEKPMTSLRALQGRLPAPIPEPSPLAVLLTAGMGLAAFRLLRRATARAARRRPGRRAVSSARGGSR